MRLNDFLNKAERIVKRYVSHYRSDFYDWDVEVFGDAHKAGKDVHYAWYVRDGGTHLIADENDVCHWDEAISHAWSNVHKYDICFVNGQWYISRGEKIN